MGQIEDCWCVMTGADSRSWERGGRRRSPDETRQEILGAARAFLWERPFREMTVGQLMEGTAVGRSTFYIHFHDVYELAAALLETIDNELERSTREGRSRFAFPQSMENALAGVVGVWQHNGPVLRAISAASTQDARLEALYRDGFTERAIDRVCHAIDAGQADGHVDPSLEPREVASLLVFMTHAYLSDKVGRNLDGDSSLSYRTLLLAWERILTVAESE